MGGQQSGVDDGNSGDEVNDSSNDANQTADPRAIDGEPCTDASDCQSETCLSDPEWPGGYCTSLDCSTFEDCANDEVSDNRCLQSRYSRNYCIRICDPGDIHACRSGYRCQPIGNDGSGWCAPNPYYVGDATDDLAFELHCASADDHSVDLDFNVSKSLSSYMIVPISSHGGLLDPRRVTTEDGTVINFRQANRFQTAGAQLFGSVNPTIIPATPDFQFQLQSGDHIYRLDTLDAEICYFLIESPQVASTTIDLNIYLVGLDDLDLNPGNAADHKDLQETLTLMEDIYKQADIGLGTIRFYDVPSSVEESYRIVRSQSDVGQLASHSTAPGSDKDSALSANIFIVERFAFSGGGSVLGISQGIPGIAGLHGTTLSGVALTGEYMGHTFQGGNSGNQFTANILAHELGHFLGLFHTSESSGQRFDPLDDTPRCTNFSNPSNCPDWGNLMFPLADFSNTSLSSDQSFVIGVNPLTK